jgi:hypothetical protein
MALILNLTIICLFPCHVIVIYLSQCTTVVHGFARFWNKKRRLFILATQLSACREEPMVG